MTAITKSVTPRRIAGGLLATAGATMALCAPAGAAGPLRDCGAGEGGGYRNVTARNVTCVRANAVARELDHRLTACLRTEVTLSPCTYRWGAWSARGRWFTDRYG